MKLQFLSYGYLTLPNLSNNGIVRTGENKSDFCFLTEDDAFSLIKLGVLPLNDLPIERSVISALHSFPL